jgi:hypothetical protein
LFLHAGSYLSVCCGFAGEAGLVREFPHAPAGHGKLHVEPIRFKVAEFTPGKTSHDFFENKQRQFSGCPLRFLKVNLWSGSAYRSSRDNRLTFSKEVSAR